jgi:hypothetical protein
MTLLPIVDNIKKYWRRPGIIYASTQKKIGRPSQHDKSIGHGHEVKPPEFPEFCQPATKTSRLRPRNLRDICNYCLSEGVIL